MTFVRYTGTGDPVAAIVCCLKIYPPHIGGYSNKGRISRVILAHIDSGYKFERESLILNLSRLGYFSCFLLIRVEVCFSLNITVFNRDTDCNNLNSLSVHGG